jgi:hypothetical protein
VSLVCFKVAGKGRSGHQSGVLYAWHMVKRMSHGGVRLASAAVPQPGALLVWSRATWCARCMCGSLHMHGHTAHSHTAATTCRHSWQCCCRWPVPGGCRVVGCGEGGPLHAMLLDPPSGNTSTEGARLFAMHLSIQLLKPCSTSSSHACRSGRPITRAAVGEGHARRLWHHHCCTNKPARLWHTPTPQQFLQYRGPLQPGDTRLCRAGAGGNLRDL